MGVVLQGWAALNIVRGAGLTLFKVLGLAVVEEVMQTLLCSITVYVTTQRHRVNVGMCQTWSQQCNTKQPWFSHRLHVFSIITHIPHEAVVYPGVLRNLSRSVATGTPTRVVGLEPNLQMLCLSLLTLLISCLRQKCSRTSLATDSKLQLASSARSVKADSCSSVKRFRLLPF